MSAAEIKTVFMAGSGFMGSAIAYLVATKTGAKVHLYDISAESLKKASAGIEKIGKSSVEKGFISQDKLGDAIKRIVVANDLDHARDADLVIEAIAEVLTA